MYGYIWIGAERCHAKAVKQVHAEILQDITTGSSEKIKLSLKQDLVLLLPTQ